MSTPAPLSWHGWPVCDANTSNVSMQPQPNARPPQTRREDPRRTCNTAGAGIKVASVPTTAKTHLRPSDRQIPARTHERQITHPPMRAVTQAARRHHDAGPPPYLDPPSRKDTPP